MNSAIQISILDSKDIGLVNDFYNRIYNLNRTIQQFLWEFINGPCGKAIYVVAKDVDKNNRIVGTQCAIPLNLIKADGEIILTAKSEDTLVDPEYRGRKIFDNMYKLLFEECEKAGIAYIWGFTYVPKPFIKIGFHVPFKASLGLITFQVFNSYSYLKNLNVHNNLIYKIKLFVLVILSRINSLKFYFSDNKIENYNVNESNVKELNSLLHKISSELDGSFFLSQDPQFLNWRIHNNPYPLKYYQSTLMNPNGDTVANIIYYIDSNGLCYIIQQLFDPSVPLTIRKAFLRRVFKKLMSHKIFMIRCWGFETNKINSSDLDILKSLGFIFLKKGISFVWCILNNKNNLEPSKMIISRMSSQGTR